mgnify:CR=1 FL=1|jgi:hypothetical protein
MCKSLVLGFVSLMLLVGCSAVGAGLGKIDSDSTPPSSGSAPSSYCVTC